MYFCNVRWIFAATVVLLVFIILKLAIHFEFFLYTKIVRDYDVRIPIILQKRSGLLPVNKELLWKLNYCTNAMFTLILLIQFDSLAFSYRKTRVLNAQFFDFKKNKIS